LREFLEARAPGWPPPRLPRKALVQDHCHQKAVIGISAEHSLLTKMGVDFSTPNDGCCGMAGSFGFESSHYDLSMNIGDRRLFPALTAAAPETLLIADGFSCREQIRQMTGRLPLHLAEVLAMGRSGVEPRPPAQRSRRRSRAAVWFLAGASAAAGALLWRRFRRKTR